MHFSITATLSLLTLSGGALAQEKTVHVVSVGSSSGDLTFTPSNLKASVGDMVQFQFWPQNHSVVQSTFDAPCTPINKIQSNVTGFYSGFQAVKATDQNAPVYTMEVQAATPMWLYCSQGKHCQSGMVMVINENTAANSTRSLTNYITGAKAAAANLSPSSGPNGGSLGPAANGTAGSAGEAGGSSTTSGGVNTQTNTGGAMSGYVVSGTVLLAAGAAWLL